jgi:hypothetical protein
MAKCYFCSMISQNGKNIVVNGKRKWICFGCLREQQENFTAVSSDESGTVAVSQRTSNHSDGCPENTPQYIPMFIPQIGQYVLVPQPVQQTTVTFSPHPIQQQTFSPVFITPQQQQLANIINSMFGNIY